MFLISSISFLRKAFLSFISNYRLALSNSWFFISYRMLGLAGFVFISFFALTTGANPPVPNDLSHLQDSVYKMSSSHPIETEDITAFPIGPKLFATTARDALVADFIQIPPETILLTNDKGETLNFDSWLKVDPALGLALFTTKQSVDSYLTLSNRESIDREEELSIIGYPMGKLTKIDIIFSKIHFDSQEAYFKNPFSILAITKESHTMTDFDLYSASGSPVFDEKGEVVGILSGYYPKETNLRNYWRAKEINKFKMGILRSLLLENMRQSLSNNCSYLSLRACVKQEYDKLVEESLKSQDVFSVLKLAEIYHYELRDFNRASELLNTAINMVETDQYKLYKEQLEFLEVSQAFDLWRMYNWLLASPILRYLERDEFNKNVSSFIGEMYVFLIERHLAEGNYKKFIQMAEQLINSSRFLPAHKALLKLLLGELYHNGLGVKRNDEKAKEFLKEAIKEIDASHPYLSRAKDRLGSIYYYEGYYKEAKALLEDLTKKEAPPYFNYASKAHIKVLLAQIYILGGIEQDFGKARAFLEEVAGLKMDMNALQDQGRLEVWANTKVQALILLGQIYFNGLGVEQDLETARNLWKDVTNMSEIHYMSKDEAHRNLAITERLLQEREKDKDSILRRCLNAFRR